MDNFKYPTLTRRRFLSGATAMGAVALSSLSERARAEPQPERLSDYASSTTRAFA